MHDNVTMPHLNVEVFAQGLPKDLAIRSRSAPGHQISATWGRGKQCWHWAILGIEPCRTIRKHMKPNNTTVQYIYLNKIPRVK